MSCPVLHDIPDFLRGDSVMARRMAAHDWAGTPVGPPWQWPEPLRTALVLMLGSPLPMRLGWGPDLLMFYNDAYLPVLGDRQADALGRPLAQVWPDIWDDIRPLLERAQAGTPTRVDDQHLRMQRGDGTEDTWWSCSHTPLRDRQERVVAVLSILVDQSRHVHAEHRLQRERERLERMFAQTPTFLAVLDGPRHRFEFANPGYQELVGRHDLLGRELAQALPEAVAQGHLDILDQVYASGEPFTAEGAPWIVHDGHGGLVERYLDFVYQPILDADGKVEGIFVDGVDVTARARSEMALHEREAQLRLLNEDLERHVAERARERSLTWQVSPDLLAVIDADGFLEKTNPAWAQVLDWPAEELEGRALWSLVHPEDEAATRSALARLQAGEPLLHFEHRLRRRASGWRRVSWVAVPEGGKYYGSARDVTEEHAAQQALAASQLQLRALFESSYQLLLPCTPGGRVTDANRTALEVMDRPREAVVGLPLWELPCFAQADGAGARVHALFERARAVPGQRLRAELAVACPPGERIMDVSLRATAAADGEVSAVVLEAIDISERRQAEESLVQSQKLEAMGQLTGGVAHDFNNLLTPIVAALDLAADPDADPQRRARTVAVAQQSAERAATLVQRLLAFARRQPLRTGEVAAAPLVEGIAALMRSSCDPRIRVLTRLEPELPQAIADHNQVEMALLNLGVNARDAMPEGGTLTFGAHAATVGADTDAAGDLEPGRYVVLSVLDTGHGMDEATRTRAIEPFFSTKGVGRGTGLGLSMAHGLASQLGGRLTIVSAPGAGTRIELWLPTDPQAPPS
ncbi:MAG: PAS domain-containing protein [Pseudoxanthomonas sp.]